MNIFGYELTLEKRTSATDLAVDTLVARATGNATDIMATAAVEIAAGLWGRAFASAKVNPVGAGQTAGITPSVLEMIGRGLIRRGEILFQIVVDNGRVRLVPAASFSVMGGPDSWTYEVSIPGPSDTYSRQLDQASVVHIRYGNDPREPWKGRSPVSYASVSSDLAARMEKRLSEEAGTVAGQLLPTPTETGDSSPGTGSKIEDDLKNLKGAVAIVPSTTSDWQGTGARIGSQSDWMPRRLGMDPPQAEVALRSDVGMSILNACGVPPELIMAGDGTGSREAWRRFLHGTVDPVSRLVAQELTEKLETEVSLDLGNLHASDVQGRARAFQSLVVGGMDIGKAAAVTGLLVED